MPKIDVLKPPPLPAIEVKLYWLSGEGCGSWFRIEKLGKNYVVCRLDPGGKPECKGLFRQVAGQPINIADELEFTYLSHCAEVNIIQNDQVLKFELVKKL